MSKTIPLVLMALLMVTSGQALAYIGPGAGISVLGSLLSILATIFVAIGAVLFWPVRKLLKRRRARREAADVAVTTPNPGGVDGNDGPGDEHRA